MKSIIIGALAALAMCVGGKADAQSVSAKQMLAATWDNGNVAQAVAFHRITQTLSENPDKAPPAVLDSLARGLARIAQTAHSNEMRTAIHAIAALQLSAAETVRHPYPQAFARLRDVFESASDTGVRAAALNAITELQNRDEVMDLLRRVAVAPADKEGRYARPAVEALSVKFGDEGRSILKQIDESGAVKRENVRSWLRYLAQFDYHIPQQDRVRK
jgi:hypothetical protein